ncbi:endonuclease/exonuclease/phosphatase family protein [Micromonospora sp. NBC_01813]|uniref:endonuclease/exonuclease/phosphatase family protein n=1 Tax=Micromonospora sp. NBC_01813 TaxID=2975988 RepID=UPI002DD81720|nr:endonuclease/exonuclease/phosphatase family protein [Micromonospora sp. NBC_01813]WSA10694.1 endonuclease/exonuclease/phosphatase family protein [Micromonospora sp. NBC_01813]
MTSSPGTTDDVSTLHRAASEATTVSDVQPLPAAAEPTEEPSGVEESTGPGRWGRWWRRWLGRVFLTGSGLWLCYVLAHRALSGRVWWWVLAELIPPVMFLAVPLAFAVAAAGCRRTRRPAALLCAAALLAGGGLSGINLPGPLRPVQQVPGDALRIVSWNTLYWHPDGGAADFYQMLRDQQADVYLLQEYIAEVDGVIVPIDERDRLRREMPGYEIAIVGELLTLSRFPIVDQMPVEAVGLPPAPDDFTDFWHYQVLRTDLRVDGQVLSVYNAHVPVPLWVGGPSVFSRQFHDTIREQHQRRVAQLRALSADVAGNANPVLLAGDLNTTPAMGDLRRLPAGLRDAVSASRSLYPASWQAGQLPAWRLDWALVSDAVTVHRYEFGDARGMSDHLPQTIWMSL